MVGRWCGTIVAALSISACSYHTVRVISDVSPPVELAGIVVVHATVDDGRAGMRGHGYFIGPVLHTVEHMRYRPDVKLFWEWNGQRGEALLMEANKDDDHMTLRTTTTDPFPPSFVVGEEPDMHARLWWVGFEDKPRDKRDVIYMGYYMGLDHYGNMMIDGAGTMGISGSPILTDKGEVVGTMIGMGDQVTTHRAFRPDPKSSYSEMAQYIIHLTRTRPMVWGRPMWN